MNIRNFSMFFWKRFEEHRERVAFLQAAPDGAAAPLTFWQWTRDVQRLAMGLLGAGFEPGQRMAIVAPGRREWFDVAFAVWLNGGVVVPLVAGRDRRETLRCLARAGVEWIAADTHAALDVIRGQGDKIPEHLRWLSFEARRVGGVGKHTFELPTMVGEGRDLLKRGKLEQLAERTYAIERSSPALVLYPLEPGDDPHGAFFGGGKLGVMLESLGSDLQLEGDERLAPLLSMGWHYGVLVSIATLLQGGTLLSAENARALEARFNELQPTTILCGPAWLEGQSRGWLRRIEQAPEFIKKVESGATAGGLTKALALLGAGAARSALYDPIRRELGDVVRRIYVAGGTVPDEVADVLEHANVPLLGIFGLPEAGVTHLERLGATKRGSVGRPVTGYVCKLRDAKGGESGEILVRSDVLFDGYWDDEGPRSILDGYLQSGVEGRLESGFLFID